MSAGGGEGIGPGGRVLIAPDKFKGTMNAVEVAEALAAGVRGGAPGCEVEVCPLADGGEGTLEALIAAIGGEIRLAPTTDPLGRETEGRFGVLADGRGVVEVAEASGLWRLAPEELDPLTAGTEGTGALIAAAIEAGVEEVLVACGGSATCDGGAGALREFDPGGVSITALCDTEVPFELAAEVFAPQKGAGAREVATLRRRLDELAVGWPRDPRGRPMTGAAGGLSGGLWAHGGELRSGAAMVFDAAGLDVRVGEADLVITGEGCLDATTLTGKAPARMARLAAAAGTRCVAVVGRNELEASAASAAGFSEVAQAGNPDELCEAARKLTERLIRRGLLRG